jgi:hypothetical protein
MEENLRCLLCDKELEGVVEVITVRIGRLPLSRFRESSDCNWARCKTCNRSICKRCYRGRPISCCETAFSIRRQETEQAHESSFLEAA